jgi:tungstate transport system substrate-binding protein
MSRTDASDSALERVTRGVRFALVWKSPLLTLIPVMLALVPGAAGTRAGASAAERPFTLAVTPGVTASGLLTTLIPRFERQAGLKVKVVTVSAQALVALGRRGEADALLVESTSDGEGPLDELESAGRVLRVRSVMLSPLLIVGPREDPAKVRGLGPGKAFAAIAKVRASFVSRGDGSAVHDVEVEIWDRVDVAPKSWPGYRQARSNMEATLRLASQIKAYALTDQSTYLRLRDALAVTTLVEGFKMMQTAHSVVEVKPARRQGPGAKAAEAFGDFMVSAETQELIRTFGTDKYGGPLFVPDAEP